LDDDEDDDDGVVGVGQSTRRHTLLCIIQEEQAVHKVVSGAGLVTGCCNDEACCGRC